MTPINLTKFLKKLKVLILIISINYNGFIFCNEQDMQTNEEINTIKNIKPILDKVSININGILVTESEIQFLMKVFENRVKYEKENIKVILNQNDLRKQAIEEIINLCTCHKIMKDHLEQAYNNMSDFNNSNLKTIQEYIKANSFRKLSNIGFDIIASNADQSTIKKLCSEIHSEAQKLHLDGNLYLSYQIHTKIRREVINNITQTIPKIMLLTSQVDSEIEKIIQEMLHESTFRIEKLYYELSKKRTRLEVKDRYRNMNDFLEIHKSSNFTPETSLSNVITAYENLLKLKEKPKLKRYRLQWDNLSPILRKHIQSLNPGQVCGPIEENNQLVLYKVLGIKFPNKIQEVKKYKLRILFKQISAISNDAVLSKKLKNWIKLIEKGEESFENIVLKYSDAQKNTTENGIIEWKQIDYITTDPKLQLEIQKLNNNNRLSPPIKCKDGWYIVEFIDIKTEEEDLSNHSSLKELARTKIINKSTEKIVISKIEQEKQKLKIKFYD